MLLARYIFNDPKNFNKDFSGNTTGVVGGTIIESDKAAPGFEKCAHFNGSSFIQIGRKAMSTKSITVSSWAYSSDWGKYLNQRIISCTEGGGWDFFEYNSKMSFECYISGVGYKYAIDDINTSNLPSGWHHFVGTFYNGYLKFYRDGVLKQSIYTGKNTEIQYNSSNSIFIGCEAGGSATSPSGEYFEGDISDVRIYSEALSDSQIKYMYNNTNPITIEKVNPLNGNIVSNGGEFIENSSLCFNQNGNINCYRIVEGSTSEILADGKLSFNEFIEV